MLHVRNRRDACRSRKSAFERAFGERRAFDHFLDRVSNGEMRTQPLLRALDITVAVIGFSLEDNVRSESVLMKLEREATCDFLCGRAGVACDEVKSHVVPGRRCA